MQIRVKKQLEAWRKAVDAGLKKYLTGISGRFSRDIEIAMKYSVFSRGKRIRPILTIASADCCGVKFQDILPAACAIELIHTYSLIHDDLPSMDNSDYRRGKLTSHKKFNEGLAVLAGDALLTRAFEIIASSLNTQKITEECVVQAISIITKAIGSEGMIGGQVADTFTDYRRFKKEGKKMLINFIHSHKTGDLIEASVLIGGVLSGAKGKKLSALKSYGRKIGYAFQIVDDIFDEDENRLTYPFLFGKEQSKQQAVNLIQQAKTDLKLFEHRAYILDELADFVVERTY